MFKATGAALKGTAVALIVATSLAATPDANAMSKEDRRALAGALVGGLAGSLLSNGDPWATAGGALAGGAIGKATTRDHRDRDRWRNDDRRAWESRERERHEWESRERDRRDWEARERERRQREYWRNR